MKFNLKERVLSAALATTILLTACGSTNDGQSANAQNKKIGSVKAEPKVTIEKEQVDIVASPVEPELTEEERQWQALMMPNVEGALNVRVEANIESDLAGKLRKGDVATVLEAGTEWTKIQSGELVGYVSNEYCIYGLEALAYAKANVNTVATATADGLRIREQMSTESKVIKKLNLGEKLVVDTAAVTEAGWVAVKYNDSTCYVSADYVTVGMDLGTGITIAEIKEQQRKEAEAKARAEAEAKAKAEAEAAKKAAQTTSGKTASGKTTSGKTTKSDLEALDDVTLLAAIIYCEADGSSYECKLAVASVVMNRLNSSKFPNTLAGVLAQSGQFPPATNGKLMNRLNSGKVTESYYDIAREALAGKNNAPGYYFFNAYNGTQTGMRIDGMIFW